VPPAARSQLPQQHRKKSSRRFEDQCHANDIVNAATTIQMSLGLKAPGDCVSKWFPFDDVN
jgi:hypothetical protein